MIKLLSRVRYPEYGNEELEVKVDSKRYNYRAVPYLVDKFEWMLKKKLGFKALNYLKIRSELIK